jgi:hypothetical protein
MMTTAPSFVLWSVIDGRVTIGEELWDQGQLRQRLAEVMPARGYQVFWGVAGTELRVDVVRRDGMFLSSWRCPECGAPETCWDLRPTPEMVIGKLSSHSCDRAGYVRTAPAGDATGSVAEAVADVLADDVDEDEAWEELPSVPVTAGYTESAAELEALEAGDAAEVGAGFFDSLVLVDAMGVAL